MFLGYYDAGAGVVKGTVFVVAHPITTIEGLGTAVAHPIITGKAVANGVAEDWNSGTRGQGKLVGGILIAVGTAVAPAADEPHSEPVVAGDALVAQQEWLTLPIRHQEVGASIIIVVRSRGPHAVPFAGHPGSFRHIRKGSIMIVVV